MLHQVKEGDLEKEKVLTDLSVLLSIDSRIHPSSYRSISFLMDCNLIMLHSNHGIPFMFLIPSSSFDFIQWDNSIDPWDQIFSLPLSFFQLSLSSSPLVFKLVFVIFSLKSFISTSHFISPIAVNSYIRRSSSSSVIHYILPSFCSLPIIKSNSFHFISYYFLPSSHLQPLLHFLPAYPHSKPRFHSSSSFPTILTFSSHSCLGNINSFQLFLSYSRLHFFGRFPPHPTTFDLFIVNDDFPNKSFIIVFDMMLDTLYCVISVC